MRTHSTLCVVFGPTERHSFRPCTEGSLFSYFQRESGNVVSVVTACGVIRNYRGSFRHELSCILTETDIKSMCLIELTHGILDPGKFDLALCVLHSTGLIRIWCVYDGCLIGEVNLNCTEANAMWSLRGSILVQIGVSDLKLFDANSGSEVASLTGFSTAASLRQVEVKGDFVSVIDCEGKVWIGKHYRIGVTMILREVIGYSIEPVSVSLGNELLAVVSAKRVVVFQLKEDGADPIRSMLVEDLVVQWKGVVITSPVTVLGWTSSGRMFEIYSETEVAMSSKIESEQVAACVAWSRNTVLLQSCLGFFFHITVVDYKRTFSGYMYRIRAVNEMCNLQSVASDSNNLFHVSLIENERLIARPLSVPDCSFELEIPNIESIGAISCISGTASKGRLLIGTSLGHVVCYRVGASKIEKIINLESFSRVVQIDGLVGAEEGSSFYALDSRGVINILNKDDSVVCRMQPNWLPGILRQGGFRFTVKLLDPMENLVECRIVSHLYQRSYIEQWSIEPNNFLASSTNTHLVPEKSPQVPIVEKSVSLLDFFKPQPIPPREPCAPQENLSCDDLSLSSLVTYASVDLKNGFQIVSFPLVQDYRNTTALRELLLRLLCRSKRDDFHFSLGLSRNSKFTSTLQAGFRSTAETSQGAAVSYLNTLMSLSYRLMGEKIPTVVKLPNSLSLSLLTSFISSERTAPRTKSEAEFLSGLLSMVQSEVSLRLDEIRPIVMDLFSKDSNQYLWLFLILVSVSPHSLHGYSKSVAELSGLEILPETLSHESQFWVSTVELILRKVHANSWLEIKIFASCYPHLRKFIFNKPLFNEIFVVLCSNVDSAQSETQQQFISDASVDCLLSIGLRNPSKFSKRLALQIKTSHSAAFALHLIQHFVIRYTRHSLIYLPILFESVVLLCMDPMDYRIRKSAVVPVTELFKTLTKEYPMTAFHQGKQKFAIGTSKGQVNVYDIRSGTKWRILDGHTGAISAVGYDFSGKYICSYSATDCTARVWHMTGGGIAGVTAVVVNANPGGSVLGGLIGSSGGKCILVKQLGNVEEETAKSDIKHPFNLAYRICGVKVRWTSDNEILVVRETGRGFQIRI